MYVTMFLFLCTAGTVLCCVRCRYRDELFRLQVPSCVVEELWSRGHGGVRWPYCGLGGVSGQIFKDCPDNPTSHDDLYCSCRWRGG